MSKRFLTILFLNMAAVVFFIQNGYATNSKSIVTSCNYSDKKFPVVDSASKAAPDTIRPSMDTTSVKLPAVRAGKDSL